MLILDSTAEEYGWQQTDYITYLNSQKKTYATFKTLFRYGPDFQKYS